jgi:CBS domain-containing protein
MQVREVMSSPAITVSPATSVQEVARILRENHISGVPVVDAAGELLGIVSELDLIARSAPLQEPTYVTFLSAVIPLSFERYREYKEQLRQALATNAEELMGVDDLERAVVSPDTPIEEALQRMMNPEITLLPVVEAGKVIGVVTRTDMVQLIEQLELELIRREEAE